MDRFGENVGAVLQYDVCGVTVLVVIRFDHDHMEYAKPHTDG